MRTPRNPNPTSHRFHPQKAPGFWPTKKSMYRCCADRTGFLGFVQSSEDVLACFFSIYINVVWNFPLMEKDLVCLQLCCSCCMQLLVFEGVAVACFVKERFAPFRVSNLSPQFRWNETQSQLWWCGNCWIFSENLSSCLVDYWLLFSVGFVPQCCKSVCLNKWTIYRRIESESKRI